jgi:hypothetical protein
VADLSRAMTTTRLAAGVAFGMAAILSGCGQAESPHNSLAVKSASNSVAYAVPATPVTLTGKPRLQRLGSINLVGVRLRYLESIIGPAMKVDGGWRTYAVDGCNIRFFAKGGSVKAFSFDTGPDCTLDLSSYYWPIDLSPQSGFTFAQFEKSADAANFTFSSDCIVHCGNAADPTITVHSIGLHSVGFIEYAVTGGDDVDDTAWRSSMPDLSEDSINNSSTCDKRFQSTALMLTKGTKVDEITIGMPVPVPAEAACKDGAPSIDADAG